MYGIKRIGKENFNWKGGKPKCIDCGKSLFNYSSQRCFKCKEKFQIKENNPHWKGGKTIDKDGYILIHNPNHPYCNGIGYVREHRLVVEKIIGRYLLLAEPVHHLGKKDNNKPEMLMAFVNNSAHQRFEQGIVKPEEIIFDGSKLI